MVKIYNSFASKFDGYCYMFFYSEFTECSLIISKFANKYKQKKIRRDEYEDDKSQLQKVLDKVNPCDLAPAKGEFREIQMKELSFAQEIIEDIYKNTYFRILFI